jgi:hypothetical protein
MELQRFFLDDVAEAEKDSRDGERRRRAITFLCGADIFR